MASSLLPSLSFLPSPPQDARQLRNASSPGMALGQGVGSGQGPAELGLQVAQLQLQVQSLMALQQQQQMLLQQRPTWGQGPATWQSLDQGWLLGSTGPLWQSALPVATFLWAPGPFSEESKAAKPEPQATCCVPSLPSPPSHQLGCVSFQFPQSPEGPPFDLQLTQNKMGQAPVGTGAVGPVFPFSPVAWDSGAASWGGGSLPLHPLGGLAQDLIYIQPKKWGMTLWG